MYDPCIVIPKIACVHEKCKVSGELCGPFSGLILYENAMLGPETESSLNFQRNLQCDLGNTSYFKKNHSSTSQKNKSSQKVPEYAQYVPKEHMKVHFNGVTEQLLCNLQIAARLL